MTQTESLGVCLVCLQQKNSFGFVLFLVPFSCCFALYMGTSQSNIIFSPIGPTNVAQTKTHKLDGPLLSKQSPYTTYSHCVLIRFYIKTTQTLCKTGGAKGSFLKSFWGSLGCSKVLLLMQMTYIQTLRISLLQRKLNFLPRDWMLKRRCTTTLENHNTKSLEKLEKPENHTKLWRKP